MSDVAFFTAADGVRGRSGMVDKNTRLESWLENAHVSVISVDGVTYAGCGNSPGEAYLSAKERAKPPTGQDDIDVDNFARMLKAKLAKDRASGRSGLRDPSWLATDDEPNSGPISLATYCMYRALRGETGAAPLPLQQVTSDSALSRQNIAKAFNEWIDLYTKDPERFSKLESDVIAHLRERLEGKEPTYGDRCAEIFCRLIAATAEGLDEPVQQDAATARNDSQDKQDDLALRVKRLEERLAEDSAHHEGIDDHMAEIEGRLRELQERLDVYMVGINSKTEHALRRIDCLEKRGAAEASGTLPAHAFETEGMGSMGGTPPGQRVTADNIMQLPPGSVVRQGDGSRIIHLHDDVWMYTSNCSWCYDNAKGIIRFLTPDAVACHIPRSK